MTPLAAVVERSLSWHQEGGLGQAELHMRGQRLEVSSLFHAQARKRNGPSEQSISVEIGLPRLGTARLEDRGASLRMWLADGASLDVPKDCVHIVSRTGNTLRVDWNGERVHMGFAGPIVAWRATRMMAADAAENENAPPSELVDAV